MVGVAEGLTPYHSTNLVRVEKTASGDFRNWLETCTYVPKVDKSTLILARTDWDKFLPFIAFDINRLTTAARETLQSISAVHNAPKSISWALVQAYYAAFYYSQALLRLCRISPSYLKTSDLQNLKKICEMYSIQLPFKLKTGQYFIRSDDLSKEITISKPPGGDGTHEAMWKELSNLIETAIGNTHNLAVTMSERRTVQTELEIFQKALSGGRLQELWISSMRNDVQYAQKMGGWFPYKKSLGAKFVLRRVRVALSTAKCANDFEINSIDDAERFLECCLLVCFAARSLIDQVSKNDKKTFLAAGLRRFEKTVCET